MSREEILTNLKEVLHNIHPKTDLSNVSDSTDLLHDLHVDSLSMLILALATEQKFNIRIETKNPFVTVGDVIDYIEKSL